MAKELKYLVIHCSDTPPDMAVTTDTLAKWHMGARKNRDGSYNFLGRTYSLETLKTVDLILPSGKRIKANRTIGNGWSRLGYADMITRVNSKIINVTPHNYDGVVDDFEISYGASGVNDVARHLMLVGGWSVDKLNKTGKDSNGIYLPPEETYTEDQLKMLEDYIKMNQLQKPDIIVCGHNELNKILGNNLNPRTCPNFDVQLWLTNKGLV